MTAFKQVNRAAERLSMGREAADQASLNERQLSAFGAPNRPFRFPPIMPKYGQSKFTQYRRQARMNLQHSLRQLSSTIEKVVYAFGRYSRRLPPFLLPLTPTPSSKYALSI